MIMHDTPFKYSPYGIDGHDVVKTAIIHAVCKILNCFIVSLILLIALSEVVLTPIAIDFKQQFSMIIIILMFPRAAFYLVYV